MTLSNFPWKRFITAVLVLLPFLLVIDIVYDLIFKELIWSETFAMKNLFFKIAASLVGAYFYATFQNESTNKKI